MKKILHVALLLALPAVASAQTPAIDSLKHALQTEQTDTSRVLLLGALSGAYLYSRPDTALVLAQQRLLLARKTGFARGEAAGLNQVAAVFLVTGNYPKALQLYLELLKKAEASGNERQAAAVLANIGLIYGYQGDYGQAIVYTRQALVLAERLHNRRSVQICLNNLGDNYEKLNRLDSALAYTNQAHALAIQLKDAGGIGNALTNLGNIYSKRGQYPLALRNYRSAIAYYIQEADDEGLCEAYLGMAGVFQQRGNLDSSLTYAKLSLTKGQKGGFTDRVMKASRFLTTYYTALRNIDSAFVYQSATIAAKDSLFSQEKARQIQSLSYEETVRQQQIQEVKDEAATQLKFNTLFGGVGTLLLLAGLLYRNNRQQQGANRLLTQQKTTVESTLQVLKATQAQLVQKEKMASLGELTAGIAHEIQNPLNFVNNFSEVSAELVGELEEEQQKTQRDPQLEAELLGDLKQNLQKITQHGGRASAIVRGMLEHSRSSSSEKQLTNLNALADEYLKIAYHGLRARDKDFNCELVTDFAAGLGRVDLMPQEVGRVLLNLYNNAFYAVQQKQQLAPAGYQPTVRVTTAQVNGLIEIRVSDNGMGIPDAVKDKIFQPFFTTKPTGEGTGLGLSLSYDIVTKGHGGSLSVESQDGEGTTFLIQLPSQTHRS